MQSTVSVSFFKPELGDFLYAPIFGASSEMPLSVLSALTRLNIDPWLEAAELSALSRAGATQRLAALIARLPGPRRNEGDCGAIAERLVKLLPRIKQSGTANALTETADFGSILASPFGNRWLLAIAILLLIMATVGGVTVPNQHREVPVPSATSPVQISPAND
jgi:hypothetical protein